MAYFGKKNTSVQVIEKLQSAQFLEKENMRCEKNMNRVARGSSRAPPFAASP